MLITLFSFYNAPAIFQNYINYILYNILDNYYIIIFHCLTSDMDPTGPRRLLCHRGKNLYIYRKKNPAVRLGEEKPYKPPQ
jgi:hypothetical protein